MAGSEAEHEPGLSFSSEGANYAAIWLLGVALVLAISYPDPSGLQRYTFRTLLALGAGVLGGKMTGHFTAHMKPGSAIRLRATGAMAVFAVVFCSFPAVADAARASAGDAGGPKFELHAPKKE